MSEQPSEEDCITSHAVQNGGGTQLGLAWLLSPWLELGTRRFQRCGGNAGKKNPRRDISTATAQCSVITRGWSQAPTSGDMSYRKGRQPQAVV